MLKISFYSLAIACLFFFNLAARNPCYHNTQFLNVLFLLFFPLAIEKCKILYLDVHVIIKVVVVVEK